MTRPTSGQRVALYMRVSTDGQTVENQQRELQAIAERHGWLIVGVFADEGISGAKASRPAFDKLMQGVARRDFDLIAAWAVDRLGRSLQNLLAFLGEIKAKGVDLYLHQQGLDTSTPAGKAMFQMLGVFAEFERAMIVARVHAGLARARAKGTKLGHRPVSSEVEDAIRAELAKGTGVKTTAKRVGCGVGTVQRVNPGPVVPCGICGRKVHLAAQGALVVHTRPIEGRFKRCPGSACLPLGS